MLLLSIANAQQVFQAKRVSNSLNSAAKVIAEVDVNLPAANAGEAVNVQPADISEEAKAAGTIPWSVAHHVAKHYKAGGYVVKFGTRKKADNPKCRECLNIGVFAK